eukprot:5960198-Alexandrium_andersonii.AAC.1
MPEHLASLSTLRSKKARGPKSSLTGPRSKCAQRGKRPSPQLAIGESRTPPTMQVQMQEAPPAPG